MHLTSTYQKLFVNINSQYNTFTQKLIIFLNNINTRSIETLVIIGVFMEIDTLFAIFQY